MSAKKKLVVIAGPTAVGKTAVAIDIAKAFGTEIISADSRQCYQEMNIGVARPSEKELAEVKHHFIASHSIQQKITAVDFEQYALDKLNDIFSKSEVAIVSGGTGLYIKALLEGMDEIPEVPEEVREDVILSFQQKGLEWLQQEVKNVDPDFYDIGETKNPHRLLRALEVKKATGKSITEFRKGSKAERDFDVLKIALHLPKEQLHHNINHRVEQMMEQGLLEEVKSLQLYMHLNALQTVGYKELFAYLNNELPLPQAVELIKKNTRQYAKRQLTWFRKDNEYQWFLPAEKKVIKQTVEEFVML